MSEPHYLTPDEVADALGYEKTKVYDLIAGGKLSAMKFGRRWLVPRGAVEDFQSQSRFERLRRPQARQSHPHFTGRTAEEHHVYVVESDYGVKVGIAGVGAMRARLYAIESACGLPLTLIRTYDFATKVDALEAEQAAHLRLAETRMHGEWFTCHPFEATAIMDRLYADSRMAEAA